MSASAKSLLGPLLKDVSRSFYTTLRVLPGKIRPKMGLAYLLARTTDTVADTGVLPVERRLAALDGLRRRILGKDKSPVQFGELAQKQSSAAERVLLERCEQAVGLLETMPEGDRKLIREVLEVIASGQELDLRRFGPARADSIVPLGADAELDDYTYRVAGCVGEFWTKICRAHLFPTAKVDDGFLLANGVRFGKGLQLVNVLRDLPADLRNGRCYLPADRLTQAGLKPADLLQSENEPRLRPLYNSYLDVSESHLRAGWEYTKALPRRQMRVRLACAWPILIGLDTLRSLRHGNVLDAAAPIKISRTAVKQIIRRTVLLYPFPKAWDRLVSIQERGEVALPNTKQAR
jgi:farnesyl-diphosphate farnesyltransferase